MKRFLLSLCTTAALLLGSLAGAWQVQAGEEIAVAAKAHHAVSLVAMRTSGATASGKVIALRKPPSGPIPVTANEIAAVRALQQMGAKFIFQGPFPTAVSFRDPFGDAQVKVACKYIKYLKHISGLSFLGCPKLTDKGVRFVLNQVKDIEEICSFNLNGASITDASLKELANYRRFDQLILPNTKVTDAGLKELVRLKNLYNLNLANTQVTDEGVKYLKAIKRLNRLYLDKTKVTDEGVKQLTNLSMMPFLSLNGCENLTSLKGVAEIKELWHLDISNTKVADEDLKVLKTLPKLHDLSLANTKVTDEGLKELKGLEITELNLNGCENLTSLKGVADNKELRYLGLAKTKVTDDDLKELNRLKSLDTVTLTGCDRLTDAGVKELQRSFSGRMYHFRQGAPQPFPLNIKR